MVSPAEDAHDFVFPQQGAAPAVAESRTLGMRGPGPCKTMPSCHPKGVSEPIPEQVPEVLFVCLHNAGRSQMAAALLDLKAQGSVHVRSAGSDPADRLNPAAIEAMAELGADISRGFPRPITDEAVRAADAVITMGCGDACPIYPGKRYEDWEIEDPAGKDLETVRRIRDQIGERVERLLNELAPSAKEEAADRR
jgi:arsenate reductase (thioredoxin)